MNLARSVAPVNPSHTSNVVRLPLTVGAATIAVRKLRGLTIAEKGLLYTIAAHMPDCRPSVGLLVDETGASRPQVFKLLARLEARGHVRRIRLGGRYGTNAYELVFSPAERSPGETQGSLLETSEGSLLETQGDKGEKRQDQRERADAPRLEARGSGVEPLPEPVRQDAVIPSPAELGQRDLGDRPLETPPPASGRFELPDVCFEEPKAVDREIEAMKRRRDRGEPLVSTPEHLAAAFDAGHEAVYGFQSPELRGPKTWKCAVSAAKRIQDEFFRGDAAAAFRYVMWAWEREQRARKRGRDRDRPIGWRLMFGPMVVDYRKFMADRQERAA